jgi:hypothetical protein
MLQVWRYELDVVDDITELDMPLGAVIVHLEVPDPDAGDPPSIWALVNLNSEYERRLFTLVGTGMPIPEPAKYIGTAVMDRGLHVFHAFELFKNSR